RANLDAIFVVQVKATGHDVARFQHVVLDVDADWLANVHGVANRTVLGMNPYRAQAAEAATRRRLLWPFSPGSRAVTVVEIPPDDSVGGAVSDNPAFF